MERLSLLLAICLAALLASCTPAGAGHNPSVVTIPAAGTVSVGTASVGTALPVIITPLPPDYTPPPTSVPPALTPIPALPGGLGPTELKYRLLAQFPDLFFCDPDYYPIARANESDLALQIFPELQANTEEFTTILAHNQMAGLAAFTGEQKLLIYREHKKLAAIHFTLAGNEYQFQLQVSPSKSQGELISGTIDGQAKIAVQQRKSTFATCPICLAEGTLIDTPAGLIPVQNLRLGMLVWTENGARAKIAQPVIRVGKTVVPGTHRVVHLVLADGRELWVSPAHPTADGRQVGQLQAGDALDGSLVRSAMLVSYKGYATYDLLPAGETGFYWANGILMGSTLK
jgi:hypothetical protein